MASVTQQKAPVARQRKSHRKSRLGCGNCKLRSIKVPSSPLSSILSTPAHHHPSLVRRDQTNLHALPQERLRLQLHARHAVPPARPRRRRLQARRPGEPDAAAAGAPPARARRAARRGEHGRV